MTAGVQPRENPVEYVRSMCSSHSDVCGGRRTSRKKKESRVVENDYVDRDLR